jgi:membrane dipeptidase
LVKSAGMALALAACAPTAGTPTAATPGKPADAAAEGANPVDNSVESLLASTVTADIHTHAGWVHREKAPYAPIAAPMLAGRMSVISLAIVSDSGTLRVTQDGRIYSYRDPQDGELYRRSQQSFERMQGLLERENMSVVRTADDLRPLGQGRPAALVAAEGADFLDTDLDRIDEAYQRYTLRHLQLTHYRVNALGDIQTVSSVHGGLTPFGADVIRRCNQLGVVVDVAHGTYDLVKRAAEVATRPLVLSHTSLVDNPPPFTRRISPDHARVIAGTGGVIGVWPPAGYFHDMHGYAAGIARMVDIAGIEHVGIGTDQLGLTGPSVFDTYEKLPEVAQALLATGFSTDEAAKILGGNFQRVCVAGMAA